MLVLCVDDDKEDQQIFCEALAIVDAVIDCICVNNPQDAMHVLSKISPLPDYIFTDFNMPRQDGKNFLHQLKSDLRFKDIPVVVLSTGIHEIDEMEFTRLGAQKVFSKPSTFNEMVAIFKAVMG